MSDLRRSIVAPLITLVIMFLIFMAYSVPVQGCTLWAAAGNKVNGGGTLIAKNRDTNPNQRNILKLIIPPKGYRYYGLFAEDVNACINERGLVIVRASTPFSGNELRSSPRVMGVMRKMITRCANVEQALLQRNLFVGPRFLLLADKNRIAWLEVGLDGKTAVRRTENGVLYHTNHYLDSKFFELNPSKLGESTVERERRIKAFLDHSGAFDLNDFIRISRSKEGGPNNSIWRDGRRPTATRTVASWIIWQPTSGPAKIHVRLANTGEDIKDINLEWVTEKKP